MKTAKETIISISNGEYNKEQLVAILQLCANELEIDTISEMARKENKSPQGIRTSNQYRKVSIGKQLFAVKGLKENGLPL